MIDIDDDLTVRPDRGRCYLRTTTHVVLPAQLLTRLAYTIDVIASGADLLP